MDDNEANETKSDLSYLKKSMDALEIGVLWQKIFQRFYSTSKNLQRADMSLGSCIALYNEIESFCQLLQGKFDTIEKNGLKLTTGIQKTYASQTNATEKLRRFLAIKEKHWMH